MQKRRFIPSPAMVVALIALFVALGGTSYAALTLPKNSVGTKQLQDSAVTGRKIKDGTVSAAKISLVGIDATTMAVGGVGAPAYQGIWEGGAFFYKDPWGIVHIQGNANTTGAAATGTIFTLPAGYTPVGNLYFSAYGSGDTAAYIQVTGGGDVNLVGAARDYVGLSNISFRACRFCG